jgi:uncharacterized protein (DUF433 family)
MMAVNVTVLNVSPQTYDLLVRQARVLHREPDELADELLRSHIRSTEHPYIVRREGVRGGRPVLRNSSIPVWLIVAMWRTGDSLEDIGQAYPHLEPAAIYDAISYYFDHRAEIEAEIAENRIERVLVLTGAKMGTDGVIIFPEADVPG